jgi:hypothetical protein
VKNTEKMRSFGWGRRKFCEFVAEFEAAKWKITPNNIFLSLTGSCSNES